MSPADGSNIPGRDRLTKAQRSFLTELCEGPVYRLPGPTSRMASQLRRRGLCAHKPETPTHYEQWSISDAGRAAILNATGGSNAR